MAQPDLSTRGRRHTRTQPALNRARRGHPTGRFANPPGGRVMPRVPNSAVGYPSGRSGGGRETSRPVGCLQVLRLGYRRSGPGLSPVPAGDGHGRHPVRSGATAGRTGTHPRPGTGPAPRAPCRSGRARPRPASGTSHRRGRRPVPVPGPGRYRVAVTPVGEGPSVLSGTAPVAGTRCRTPVAGTHRARRLVTGTHEEREPEPAPADPEERGRPRRTPW
jgi:hypothetical protein